eukprot:168926_1
MSHKNQTPSGIPLSKFAHHHIDIKSATEHTNKTNDINFVTDKPLHNSQNITTETQELELMTHYIEEETDFEQVTSPKVTNDEPNGEQEQTPNDTKITNNFSREEIIRQKSNISDHSDDEHDGIDSTTTKPTKRNKTFYIIGAVALFIALITIIIIVVQLSSNKDSLIISDSTFPTNEPTMKPTRLTIPEPGIPFEFFYQNKTQNMTLNTNVTYFNPQQTLKCMIEFDE